MSMEMIEERGPDRGALIRNVVIYAPTALVVVTLLLLSLGALLNGRAGAVLPGFILAIISFAVLYELIASVRDLRKEPVVIEGEIQRIWKKSKILVFGRQDYVMVDKKVFEVGVIAAEELREGQRISIRHWPHTMRVVTLERVRDTAPRG